VCGLIQLASLGLSSSDRSIELWRPRLAADATTRALAGLSGSRQHKRRAQPASRESRLRAGRPARGPRPSGRHVTGGGEFGWRLGSQQRRQRWPPRWHQRVRVIFDRDVSACIYGDARSRPERPDAGAAAHRADHGGFGRGERARQCVRSGRLAGRPAVPSDCRLLTPDWQPSGAPSGYWRPAGTTGRRRLPRSGRCSSLIKVRGERQATATPGVVVGSVDG